MSSEKDFIIPVQTFDKIKKQVNGPGFFTIFFAEITVSNSGSSHVVPFPCFVHGGI
jgi:hypothetical protein